jgi:hypothetical protein
VMDHLEQVLSTTKGSSMFSAGERKETFPAQSSQEDILAQLGVTGAPKPISDGPQPSIDQSPVPAPEKRAATALPS